MKHTLIRLDHSITIGNIQENKHPSYNIIHPLSPQTGYDRSRTATCLGGFPLIQDDRTRGVGRLYTRGLVRLSVCQRKGKREIKRRQTLSSSNTPRRILTRMSRVASSNAASTLSPLLALASTKSNPSSCAHRSPSSVGTCRISLDRSLLLPTRMHVRCGSACVRTSASQVRACSKPIVRESCQRWISDEQGTTY